MNWTPGPWRLDEGHKLADDTYHFIDAGKGYFTKGGSFGIAGYMSRADACLIASAPELAEALNDALLVMTSQVVSLEERADAITRARHALQKAGVL